MIVKRSLDTSHERVDPGDVAFRVDALGLGERSPRKINGSEVALAQQKAMPCTTSINLGSDYIASGINLLWTGLHCAGEINRGETAPAQQKAVRTSGITVSSHDLAFTVNPVAYGEQGAREINRSVDTIAQQKAMERASGICVAAHNLALGVDTRGSG